MTGPGALLRMNGPLEWIAAVGTVMAAALIAADLGRKVTGYGFVLFCAVAVTWIVSGLTSNALPIAAMNGVLLAINAWGVWQYLLNPRKKAVIERVEKVTERIEREVAAEEA
jgi:nicotinamide riboside transporter PnuC